MKHLTVLVSLIATVGLSTAHAQYVKGNEAVRVLPDGTKKVETHPFPTSTLGPPCSAERPACTPSGWYMVETRDGLQECSEIYARPGTCRESTFGTEKRPRLWIVKLKGEWMQCQHPDIKSTCVSTKTLPNRVIQ